MGANGPELQLSLWSRNLFDRAYAFVRNTDSASGVAAIFNEPRTVGIDARLVF
ncbi:MAG: hypothetical protein PGN16_01885 [Sphingomonas phyllosphaerae]|uniref:hypothetical protein n=1 Tax=Sphingomonas phyllosphaerae TaxID=257003 RepID=UPI002FF48438